MVRRCYRRQLVDPDGTGAIHTSRTAGRTGRGRPNAVVDRRRSGAPVVTDARSGSPSDPVDDGGPALDRRRAGSAARHDRSRHSVAAGPAGAIVAAPATATRADVVTSGAPGPATRPRAVPAVDADAVRGRRVVAVRLR